jgi:DNA-binding NarL/FixJ family response regulator
VAVVGGPAGRRARGVARGDALAAPACVPGRGNGGRVQTAGPVTVVVVGGDGAFAGRLADLPGVRLVACADDPRRGPRLVDAARPQVVLVGLGRDRDAVLAVVPELTVRAPDAPVLAVSALADPDPAAAVLAAVRAGAAGYLVVGDDPAALGDALRRTAAGEAVFSPGLAEVVLERCGRPGGTRAARLTAREADVLRLVVDGLTARQVATRLVLSPRTVENHIQRVLRRLDLPNRAALVRYAVEHGLA